MKKLKWLSVLGILGGLAFGAISEPDKALFPARQLLTNGGWENGTVGWTASGGTYARSTSSPGAGSAMGTWDSGSAAQTLTSTAVAIPAGALGKNGVASCAIKCATGTCTHTLNAYDGTNLLATQTITSSTSTFARTSVNFDFPTSGNIQLRISSVASDEPSISIDECFLGLAAGFNLSQQSSAVLVASGYIANTANCAPTRANTALGAFGTDSDCPGPTVVLNPGPGTLVTTDTDLLQFTMNSLPSGYYRVTMGGEFGSSANADATLAINDGTNTRGNIGFNPSTTTGAGITVVGYFQYTTSGNRTFSLYSASTSGTLTAVLNVGLTNLNFSIERFPSESEIAISFDKAAGSWSGYHDTTCGNNVTSTTLANLGTDASCALVQTSNTNFGTVSGSNTGAQITFTPIRANSKYQVCATVTSRGSASSANASVALYDSTEGAYVDQSSYDITGANVTANTTLCGPVSATTMAAHTLNVRAATSSGDFSLFTGQGRRGVIEWSIYLIEQANTGITFSNMPATPATSTLKVASALFAAPSGGACAVTYESGEWITGSPTSAATGRCVATINSSTFSSRPMCWTQASGDGYSCSLIGAPSTTSVTTELYDRSTGGASNSGTECHLLCIGPR